MQLIAHYRNAGFDSAGATLRSFVRQPTYEMRNLVYAPARSLLNASH